MKSVFKESDLASRQVERLRRFQAEQSVDIHCHFLPGLDDGPATMADAVKLCRALVDDGITTAIATPHQLGRYDGRNSPAAVRLAVIELRAVLAEESIPLQIVSGGDVRIDERMARMIDADRISTLADNGRFLLLELPHETFIDIRGMLPAFAERRQTVIVSHPERHTFLSRHPEAVVPWLANGAILQITAGSLLGAFGQSAQQAAWHFVEQNQVALVATDSHDISARPPCMTLAIDRITAKYGEAVAKRICIDNPLRVLRGHSIASHQSDPAGAGARA